MSNNAVGVCRECVALNETKQLSACSIIILCQIFRFFGNEGDTIKDKMKRVFLPV